MKRLWNKLKEGNLFIIFLLTIIHIILNGYYYGVSDQVIYLPQIMHLNNLEFLANDWYIQQPMVHYPFFFSMSLLMRALDLQTIFFVVHFFVIFLFLLGVYKISSLLFNENNVFYLTILFLYVGGSEGIGGNHLFISHLIPHSLAVPFVIFSFYFFIKENYSLAFITAGLATLFHLLLGGVLVLMFCIYLLFKANEFNWKNIILWSFFYLLLAGPNIISNLILTLETNLVLNNEITIQILSYFRHPHHHIPSSWGTWNWMRFSIVMALGMYSYRYRPLETENKHEFIKIFSVLIFGFCIIGTIFTELIPVGLVARLYLFRFTIFLWLFAIMYIAHWFNGLISRRDTSDITPLLALIIVGIIAFFYQGNKMPLFIASIFFFFYSAAHIRDMKHRQHLTNLTSIVIATLVLASLGTVFYFYPNLPQLYQYDITYDNEWKETCLWVSENTPKDAIFITPPYMEGFRLYAERAIVVDFKNFPFGESSMFEWKERIDALTNTSDILSAGVYGFESYSYMEEKYLTLNTSDFQKIADNYGASYAVTVKPNILELEPVYENSRFVVYVI